MISRDEAFEKMRVMEPKAGTLGFYIKRLCLGGFFDSAVRSEQLVEAVKDQFGRRFRVDYVPTYMKPFLEQGILRSQQAPNTRGKLWFGAWIPDSDRQLRTAAERLRLNVDTSGWYAEVAEDYQLGLSCYAEKLWKPAAVMMRRAYEGALTHRYRQTTGCEPEKQGTCQKCGVTMGKRPMSITDLHYWAVGHGLVREKMDGLSVLLKDLGAGGAHPTKEPVIDPCTAEIIVKCGAILLSDLHQKRASAA